MLRQERCVECDALVEAHFAAVAPERGADLVIDTRRSGTRRVRDFRAACRVFGACVMRQEAQQKRDEDSERAMWQNEGVARTMRPARLALRPNHRGAGSLVRSALRARDRATREAADGGDYRTSARIGTRRERGMLEHRAN